MRLFKKVITEVNKGSTVQSRREFVRTTTVALGASSSMAVCRPSEEGSSVSAVTSTSTRIGNKFQLAPAQQFALSHRAGLAINCITQLLDERQAYLPYFNINYSAHLPVAIHERR